MSTNPRQGYVWIDGKVTAQSVQQEIARQDQLGRDIYYSEQDARDDFDSVLDDFPHASTLTLVCVEVSTVATYEMTRRGWMDRGSVEDAMEHAA